MLLEHVFAFTKCIAHSHVFRHVGNPPICTIGGKKETKQKAVQLQKRNNGTNSKIK